MITVYDDAPEENKELKERACERHAVTIFSSRRRTEGESSCRSTKQKQSGGIFTKGEYSYRSPLVSELPTASLGMRTHVANATVSKSVHRLGAKKKDFRKGNPSFLVEAAGLEPTVSSTRNWRDTTFATPRNVKNY